MDPEYFNSAFVPTRNSAAELLQLPVELRHKILLHALKQQGTVELQHPVWAGLQVFSQPLFYVSRTLRDEAVGAFYETNEFLWVIDVETDLRSDPARYPSPTSIAYRGKLMAPHKSPSLAPVLPWEYPDLLKRIRKLQINVYLPSIANATTALQLRLEGLVRSLNRGHRLQSFHVLVTSKKRSHQEPLSHQEVQALETLTDMEIRGKITVQTRLNFRAVSATLAGLKLEQRMKA